MPATATTGNRVDNWEDNTSPGFGRRRAPLNSMMTSLLQRFWEDNSGQDMAEYAVVIGVIVAGVIVAVTVLGTNITTKIKAVASLL